MHRVATTALIAALCACAGARASTPTLTECLEGGDFIANAARSRDNGLDRSAFMERLHDDVRTIQAFPPALRWFVHDTEDETVLVTWSERVFDQPVAPEAHRKDFLRACFGRADATVTGSASPTPD